MAKIKEANSTCAICGQKYHLCVACERKKSTWKSWRMFVDKENCYNIYKVLNDYHFKKIEKDEARELLLKLDLSELDTFKEGIKEKINDILLVEKNTKTYRNRRKRYKVKDQLIEVVEEVVKSEIENKNEFEEQQLEEKILEEEMFTELM